MGITVEWDNDEHTVLRWDFTGAWDWQDFRAAQRGSDALIQSEAHVVDIIGDVSRSPGLPGQVFTQYRRYQRDTPANSGLVVLVGTSALIRTMVQMYHKVFPTAPFNFIFADTLDEARARLARERSGAE